MCCFKACSAGTAAWKDGVVAGRLRNSSRGGKKKSEPRNGKCWFVFSGLATGHIACNCSQE